MAGWATKIEGATIPISVPGQRRLHAPRAGRRRRADHPVELPAADGGVEARARARDGLHRRAEAGRADAALGAAPRRARVRGRLSRTASSTSSPASARRPAPRSPRIPTSTRSRSPARPRSASSSCRPPPGNLKKVSLELGGKSPNIVLADADLDLAIAGAANAIFFNHGQCCCAGSRLFVEKPIFDKVVEGVVGARAEDQGRARPRSRDGDGPARLAGAARPRVRLHRRRASRKARAPSPAASAIGETGYFVEPTVLVDTKPEMKVIREEIFGPVVAAIPFRREDEVLPVANDTTYGLAAAVWTKDIGRAHRLANALRAGHGLDQLLQRLRRGDAVRRLQAIGLGPRDAARKRSSSTPRRSRSASSSERGRSAARRGRSATEQLTPPTGAAA